MGNILTIYTLIWKNFKLQLRQPCITALELIIPVFLMLLLILMRIFVPIEVKEIETIFDAYDINSIPPDIYNTSEEINLYYAPKSAFLDDLMQDVSAYLDVTASGFDTEDELENSYISSSSNIIAGVIFNSNLKHGIQEAQEIEYTIRPENFIGRSWNLSYAMSAFPLIEITDKSDYGTLYASSGFLAIQHAVAKSIMEKLVTGVKKSFDKLYTVEMIRQPYPPYVIDSFYKLTDYYFAVVFSLCYIFRSAMIAKNLVRERQRNLKQILLLMGVSNLENSVAWFLKEFIFLLLTNMIMTAMLCIKFSGAAVFNQSNSGVILFWLCLYSADIITFAFFISAFFKNEDAAVAAVCILYLITFVPYLHSRGLIHRSPFGARVLLTLLPNTIFAYSVRVLLRLELLGKGLRWSSLGDTDLLVADINMQEAFMMLGINVVVYLILTWYFDGIFQNNHPWYFPLKASYWTGRKNIPPGTTDSRSYQRPHVFFEGDQPRVKPMIHLKNLTKKYDKKSPPIVDDVDLKVYKSKITALLGHNCSGKSTFISMLYGAITPTSGRIIIKSLNLCEAVDVPSIIPLLGICPNYNACLEELTVGENLYFFAHIKGFGLDVIKPEVSHVLGLFDLEINQNMLVSTLSPSLKRRLSVAIALVGESEVIFLDEPTLGMDSDSRRLTWDALVLEKNNRTIFFTTSHISEAYAYADKIAVFHDGHLKCYGSPMFLKKKYDVGYILTLFKEPEFNIIRIKSYISSKIPDAHIVSDTKEELKLKLPPHKCHLYADLLKGLEEQNWNIKQMVLTETPLEKLFEKITATSSSKKRDKANKSEFLKDAEQYSVSHSLTRKRNEGYSLFIQQMNALMRKKYIFSKRNIMLSFSRIILFPLAIVLSNLMKVTDVSQDHKPEDNEPFDLNAFGKTDVVYGIDPSSNLTINLGDTYASLLETENMHLVDLEEENYLSFYIKQAKKNEKTYKSKFIIGAVFEKGLNTTLITAFYNSEAYHSSVTSLLYVHNTILTYYAKETKYKFHVNSNPLPYKDVDPGVVPSSLDFDVSYFWAQDLTFGMAILMSSFVILLVQENVINFKKQQFIAGLNSFVYWFSSFLFDFCLYLIPCILVLIIFSIFETKCLYGVEELGSLAVLFFLHGLSSILFIYCCTTFSHTPSEAYIGIFLYYLFGLFFIFMIFRFEVNYNYHVSDPLDILLSALIPSYCLGRGVYNIHKNCLVNSICNVKKVQDMCQFGNSTKHAGTYCCLDHCEDSCLYWTFNHLSLSAGGIGKQLVAQACQPVVFILILALLEMEIFLNMRTRYIARRRIRYHDENVQNKYILDEANRILSFPVSQLVDENYYLILKHVLKFQPMFAVGKFSFGVKKGECFGLIGIDLSGKSTVLHMIVKGIPLSTGNIYIDGINIRKYPHKVMDKIGFSFGDYCLLKQFTVKETLTLFSQIRGIPEKEIPYFIETLTSVLCIPLDQKIKHCNSIIRRKLTVAIAIIGMPPLVLLEEPTAFMDPVSCAETREIIKLAKDEGCTIILATQKIGDCEVLCDRIGILVKGKLTYIGNFECLKDNYKDGVTIILRVKKTRQSRSRYTRQAVTVKGYLEEIKGEIEDVLPEAVLKIEVLTYLNYFVPIKTIIWSKLLKTLEDMQSRGSITSYSISLTTFDQILSYNIAYLRTEEKHLTEYLKERKIAKF